jgi:hypothetical protein
LVFVSNIADAPIVNLWGRDFGTSLAHFVDSPPTRSYRGRPGKKSFSEGGKPEGRGGALPWGVNMSGGRGQPGGIEGIEDEQI